MRNQLFDANTYFRNRQGLGRVAARRNEFGGSLGGPVWIPGLWKGTDKSFFFVNTQGFRLRQTAATSTITVAPPDFRAGNFSSLLDARGNQVAIYDPLTTRSDGAGGLTRDRFPGNIIPASRFSKVSKNVLPHYPVPNLPGIVNNVLGSSPAPTKKDSFTLKFDHRFTSNHNLSFVWNMFTTLTTTGSVFGVPDGIRPSTQSLESIRTGRLSHDWIITPRLINHVIFGYNRRNTQGRSLGRTVGQPQSFGISSQLLQPDTKCGLYIGFGTTSAGVFGAIFGTGYERVDGGADPASFDAVDTFALSDGLSWVKGRHNMKFGFESRVSRLNFISSNGCAGFNFSAATTGFPNFNGRDPRIPACWASQTAHPALGDAVSTRGRRAGTITPDMRKMTLRCAATSP
jgi:hypothetical protein